LEIKFDETLLPAQIRNCRRLLFKNENHFKSIVRRILYELIMFARGNLLF
jgi:hypothetical protein